jgi:cytochrome c-type biogenesis protein CcmH/NrfG
MWPQVKQFESHERVPFEPFADRSSRRREPAGRRTPRRWITPAAVLAVVLASGSYVVVANAVGDPSRPSSCAPDARDTAGRPSRVLCTLASAVAAPPGGRLHRWP